jgi:DNA (cytosine-5)-methyltransferase 1
MVARLQAFPNEWVFAGGKTASYRQVGNAFPATVATAVASAIMAAVNIQVRPAKTMRDLLELTA